MAIRQVRIAGDSILEKPCRKVEKLNGRLKDLIGDMFDTMYEENGVGLAAPQVGVLRQIVVIDTGLEQREPHVLINPVITEKEGEQTGSEGCLSLPGKYGTVTRPMRVKVEALDENMEPYVLEGEGLLARAICHECDHLSGHMFTEFVEGDLYEPSELAEEEEEEEPEEEGPAEEGPAGKEPAEEGPAEDGTPGTPEA